MNRTRIVAALVILFIALAHIAAYNLIAGQITEQLREQGTDVDQARWIRLSLQVMILTDIFLFSVLALWLAGGAARLRGLERMQGENADLRKALELERQLAEVDTRLHLMFETADTAMMLLSEEGEVVLTNRRAADLLLLDRNNQIHEKFGNLLAPSAKVQMEDLLRTLRELGPQSLSLALRRRDDTTLESSVQFTPFEGPKGESYISVFFRSMQPLEDEPMPVETKRLDTVLVADDEELIRLLAKNMLNRMGYKTILAADGQEALELFAAQRDQIALVILDLVMPKKTGAKVFDEIRAMDAKIPVVFCSGYADDAFDVPLNGSQRLLRKPFSLDDFEKVINAAIQSRKE